MKFDAKKVRSAMQALGKLPRKHAAASTTLEAAAKPEEQQDKQRRTICVRFYITAAEEERLNQLTDGMKNRSHWLRSRIFGLAPARPRPQIPALNRNAHLTLRAIRSKLNQLTSAINTALEKHEPLPLATDTLNSLQEMRAAVATVNRSLVKLHTMQTQEGEDER